MNKPIPDDLYLDVLNVARYAVALCYPERPERTEALFDLRRVLVEENNLEDLPDALLAVGRTFVTSRNGNVIPMPRRVFANRFYALARAAECRLGEAA